MSKVEEFRVRTRFRVGHSPMTLNTSSPRLTETTQNQSPRVLSQKAAFSHRPFTTNKVKIEPLLPWCKDAFRG